MKEFGILPSLKIKRKGIFDLEELYLMMKEWLDIGGFGKNFKETDYTESTTPKGKDIDIIWETHHDVSSYVRFKVKTTFSVRGLNKVEIQKNGKKTPRDKGRVEVRIDGKVIYDPEDKFKKNIFTFPFIKFYEVKMKKRLEDYQLELYKKLYSFHKEIKLYLEMHEF